MALLCGGGADVDADDGGVVFGLVWERDGGVREVVVLGGVEVVEELAGECVGV